LTKAQAQAARDLAVQRVKDAQAACGKAIDQLERDRAKAWLAAAHEELAEAKAKLRACNLAASGAKPLVEPSAPPPPRTITLQQLATAMLEAFQQILIADPGHPAIRTLRQHFEAERMKEAPPVALVRSNEPRSAGRPFLDSVRRQSSGPGAVLYSPKRVREG
jgi:hypothetical protein